MLLDDGTVNWPSGARNLKIAGSEVKNGAFSATFTLPGGMADGEHNIRILGGSLGSGTPNPGVSKFDTFAVVAGALSTPKLEANGTPATNATGVVTVPVKGSGFAAGTDVSVAVHGAAQKWSAGRSTAPTIKADASGNFSGTVSIGAATALAGTNVLVVSDGTNKRALVFTAGVGASIKGLAAQGSEATASIANAIDGTTLSWVSVGENGANLLATPIAVSKGAATATVNIPADAALGTPMYVGYTVSGALTKVKTTTVVSPSNAPLDVDKYDVTSAQLPQGAYEAKYSPADDKVYATYAGTKGGIVRLNPVTLEVEQDAALTPAPYGMAIASKLGQIWVTNTTGNSVSAIDMKTLKPLATFTEVSHGRDLAVDETTGKVYVSSVGAFLDVYDANTLKYDGRIALADGFRAMAIDIDQKTGTLYTVDMGSPRAVSIAVRDTAARAIAAPKYYDLGSATSASGAAFDTRNGQLFTANQASNDSVAVNVTGAAQPTSIQTGAGSLSATYDPIYDMVWVANRGGGTVSGIDAKSRKKIANIPAGVNPNHMSTGANGVIYAVNKADANRIFRISPKTALDLAASPASSKAGEKATFTAKVSPAALQGDVVFTAMDADGNVLTLGTGSLVNGAASVSTAELPVGTWQIFAVVKDRDTAFANAMKFTVAEAAVPSADPSTTPSVSVTAGPGSTGNGHGNGTSANHGTGHHNGVGSNTSGQLPYTGANASLAAGIALLLLAAGGVVAGLAFARKRRAQNS